MIPDFSDLESGCEGLAFWCAVCMRVTEDSVLLQFSFVSADSTIQRDSFSMT